MSNTLAPDRRAKDQARWRCKGTLKDRCWPNICLKDVNIRGQTEAEKTRLSEGHECHAKVNSGHDSSQEGRRIQQRADILLLWLLASNWVGCSPAASVKYITVFRLTSCRSHYKHALPCLICGSVLAGQSPLACAMVCRESSRQLFRTQIADCA
jgi:hypothetical protein